MSSETETAAPTCEVCHGTGLWTGQLVKLDNTVEYRYQQPCPAVNCPFSADAATRQEYARLERAFGSAHTPTKFLKASLASFAPEVGERVSAALAKNRGLFIQGATGVGKTHLLCAVFAVLFRSNQTAFYLPVPDWLTALRDTYQHRRGDDAPTEAAMIGAATSVDWLGLDDLGAEAITAWSRQVVFQLVNGRYLENRPIIVTSNVPMHRLEEPEVYGSRVPSRLREMCDVIAISGIDRRRGAA
jgi:DNA replication protein DnaC